jgi:hypothetical protein
METLPDGRKVFHVFEVQSDWAQTQREKLKEIERRKLAGTDQQTQDYIINPAIESAKASEDPLLKDYNRLALKAAVEHAYREGADAIAISDAETAMMTEGHDRAAPPPNYLPEHVDKFGVFQARPRVETSKHAYNTLEEAQKVADEQNLWYRDNGYSKGYMSARQITIEDTIPIVSQEPGMRFNYDPNPTSAGRSGKPGSLHELAAELTKYPGERVSFGDHKNALARRIFESTIELLLG